MPTEATAPSRPRTILVVDDSKVVQRVVESTFKGGRYRVYSASDGNAGLALAKRIKPEIVLLDFQMPGMDGRALSQRIRQIDALANVPLVLISSRTDPATHAFDELGGPLRRLQKPFAPQDLVAVVEELLGAAPAEPPDASADTDAASAAATVPLPPPEPTVVDQAPAGPHDEIAAIVAERVDRTLQQFVRGTLPGLLRQTVLDTLGEAGLVERPNLVLSSSLQVLSLPDALNFVHHARIAGRLTLVSPDLLGEIFVDRGMFVFARVSRRGSHEFLTDVLLDNAASEADRQRILRAIAGARQQGQPIGRSLVRAGVIGESELMQALEQHARRAFTEMLDVPVGNFFLQTGDVPEELRDLTFRLPLMQVLMDGLRLVDEKARALKAFEDDTAVLCPVVKQDEQVRLTEQECHVLALADGQRSLRELVGKSRLGEAETLRVCHRLSRVGLLTRRSQPVAAE